MKTAIVTGASKGIGLATVDKLISDGFYVIGASRTNPNIKNDCFCWIKLDLSQKESIDSFTNELKNKNIKIDALINNAGITCDNLTENISDDDFYEVVNINLIGTFCLTKRLLPLFLNNASIVNISSVVGEQGNIGQANYSASKAAIIGLSKTWAKEFVRKGKMIRVNVVCPGFINTNMTSNISEHLKEKFNNSILLKRFGEPKEVANVIAFLVSDEASYITNAVIDVNGGIII